MSKSRQTTIADVDGALPPSLQVEASMFSGNVHPVAALFPMMTDEELDDLAADIKANGLVHPIVIDEEGQIIDGRNRLEACRRADAPVEFIEIPKTADPVAFILSANVNRRHLNKGQQAMAVAKAHRFLKKHSARQLAEESGVKLTRLAYANTVLDYAPDLADAVLSGACPLNQAYEEARNRKLTAEGAESRFARLQREAPGLAALVQEERMTLVEAEAALRERKEEEKRQVRTVTENLNTALTCLDPGRINADDSASNLLRADPTLLGGSADFSGARARRAADVLLRYAALKESDGCG